MDPLVQLSEAISAPRAGRDYSDIALCRQCGYQLRGLPEHRCPECGRWFAPTDPRTMKVPGWKEPSRRRAGRIAPIVCWVGTCLFVCGIASNVWPYPNENDSHLGPLAPAILVATYVRSKVFGTRCVELAAKSADERLARAALYTFGLMLFFFSSWISTHTCDHGWRAGTVFGGIAYSQNGGPCGGQYGLKRHHVKDNWYIWTR